MSARASLISDAYERLGSGDVSPWMALLDPAVVWRAVDGEDVEATPT